MLVAIAFIVVMGLQIGQEAYTAWVNNYTRAGLTFMIPTWPPSFIAFIGCILFFLAYLTQLFRNIVGLIAGKVVGFSTLKLELN